MEKNTTMPKKKPEVIDVYLSRKEVSQAIYDYVLKTRDIPDAILNCEKQIGLAEVVFHEDASRAYRLLIKLTEPGEKAG